MTDNYDWTKRYLMKALLILPALYLGGFLHEMAHIIMAWATGSDVIYFTPAIIGWNLSIAESSIVAGQSIRFAGGMTQTVYNLALGKFYSKYAALAAIGTFVYAICETMLLLDACHLVFRITNIMFALSIMVGEGLRQT